MGPPAFWYKVLIHMTVGTTFPCKILNNGKEPCEPLMTLYEGLSICPLVALSVGPPSVLRFFLIAEFI